MSGSARPKNRWEPKVLPVADVGDLAAVGDCLCCGHTMRLAVWRDAPKVTHGVCGPCRDAALPVRGCCSSERGCLCKRVSPQKDTP